MSGWRGRGSLCRTALGGLSVPLRTGSDERKVRWAVWQNQSLRAK